MLALKGVANTDIEFAPRVASVHVGEAQDDDGNWGQRVRLNFSSKIVPHTGSFDVDLRGAPKEDATEDDYLEEPKLGETSFSFHLASSRRIISAETWRSWDDETLRERWGYDRSNWPHRITVELFGLEAPNTTKLLGNAVSYNVYPTPNTGKVPAWKVFNGGTLPRSHSFRLEIPVFAERTATLVDNIVVDGPNIERNGQRCVSGRSKNLAYESICCLRGETRDLYSCIKGLVTDEECQLRAIDRGGSRLPSI